MSGEGETIADYTVTVARKKIDYCRIIVRAKNIQQAKRLAVNKAKRNVEGETDTFCDGDAPKYSAKGVELNGSPSV